MEQTHQIHSNFSFLSLTQIQPLILFGSNLITHPSPPPLRRTQLSCLTHTPTHSRSWLLASSFQSCRRRRRSPHCRYAPRSFPTCLPSPSSTVACTAPPLPATSPLNPVRALIRWTPTRTMCRAAQGALPRVRHPDRSCNHGVVVRCEEGRRARWGSRRSTM